MPDKSQTAYGRHRIAGLVAGPILAVAVLVSPPPSGLSAEGWAAAAVGGLMAVWWMTEALPLAATALLPLVLFPVLSIGGFEDTARSYAHPLIFLFLGGFLLARAMERWRLHRRLALQVLRLGGGEPVRIIASLMAATAFLSLWVSNTATTMVMLPIGLSVVATMRATCTSGSEKALEDYGAALMLGIAFAATIGGMGSLIGTPPNALFAGYMREAHGVEIGFAQWMLLGLPIALILLPLTWLILTRVVFRISLSDHAGERGQILDHLETPGPMSRGEILVAMVMVTVAAFWMFRPLLDRLFPWLDLSDAGIAMTGAVLLFVIPVRLRKGEFLLRWEDVANIRWDVLILFGGGLALAGAIGGTGLAGWIGTGAAVLEDLPILVLVFVITVIIVYVGELASNTAMAAIFLPIAGATAVGMGANPLLLVLPVALAATLGFMLPVATPPNAIVFGSGAVTAGQMLRAGALLDVVGIVVVALLGFVLGPLVFPTG